MDRHRGRPAGARPRRSRRRRPRRSESPSRPATRRSRRTVGAAAAAEGLAVRPLEGDLADAVVVMDVDDDGGARSGSTAASACSASPAGPSRALPIGGHHRLDRAALLDRPHPHEAPRRRAAQCMPLARGAGRARRGASSRGPARPRHARHAARGALRPPRRAGPRGSQRRRSRWSPWSTPSAVVQGRGGFDAVESHRDQSFCAHAILGCRRPPGRRRAGRPAVRRQPGCDRPDPGAVLRRGAARPGRRQPGRHLVRRRSPPRLLDAQQLEALCRLAALSSLNCKRRPDAVSYFLTLSARASTTGP